MTFGAEYVEKNLKAANNFTWRFQEAMMAWCWGFGGADDTIVGHITSGAYGHTLGSCIGLGYFAGAIGGERLEVEVVGRKFTAEVSIRPLYDPDNTRIRC